MDNKIDIAIVGGGIIGLWTAYYALKRYPHYSVVVFEKEQFLGEHSTTRNSEVLHAGIYYPTNSLKHQLCLSGNIAWREYIKEKNLSFRDCGKYIAADALQVEELELLYQKAKINSVPGLSFLTQSQIRSLNEFIDISSGFYSPSSGVLNVSESLKALTQDIENMGGVILIRNQVKLLEFNATGFTLDVNSEKIMSSILINCGGLFATEFRTQLGLNNYVNFYVKGSYLRLRKKINADKLIYPIPPKHGLGLGIHLTLNTDGDQKFGPNTEPIITIDYSVAEDLIEKMYPEIKKIFKTVKAEDLELAYSGIRPKIKNLKGELITDFIVNSPSEHNIASYYEFLGIESPGITAAPSLSKMLIDNM